MWYQPFVPYPYIIVPIMIITSTCHTPKNNTDVIITYSNHAEADSQYNQIKLTTEAATTEISTEKEVLSSDEGVVFVPNERTVMRNEEYLQPKPKPLSINDILTRESINDVLGARDIKLETENPIKEDIIFVSGKNKEIEEKQPEKKPKHDLHRETGQIDSATEKAIVPKLNCKNLDCNNTIQSICGSKMERNELKYRMFLNDCFFRKVNCQFKKKENRYNQVPLENCQNIAIHVSQRPQYNRNKRRQGPDPIVQIKNSFRRSDSRRSLTVNINGKLCDHPCPKSCPENYDPECAISDTGRLQKKVFVNHCQMDLNSCTFGIVWQKRPLGDCVGGKKADMHQNRGFISWMQSVGIVDKKGRLNLS